MDRVAAGCHPGPVTPSDDPSPPRRPIFFPVVIATVFLTIIGMTAGYTLGQSDHSSAQASPETSSGQTPSPVMSGKRCPDATLRSAADLYGHAVDLRQRFKITTSSSVVWICVDAYGRLYYQGNNQKDSAITQGTNGLFMYQVTNKGDDDYVAVNDQGYRFEVTRKSLVVSRPTGQTATYRVTSAE
jgi:hypothetical protein